MVAKFSKERTSKGEGIEIVANHPYEDETGKGQFTHKRIYVGSHIPGWLKVIIPASILCVEEKSWNSYPYVRNVYHCPFFGERFSITAETRYIDGDDGKQENVLNVPKEKQGREVDFIDIVTEKVDAKYYKKEEDPLLFVSQKTGRGPLKEGWLKDAKPKMCIYKLQAVQFKYWGFQTKVEQWLHKSFVRDVILLGHKQAYTWMDEWCGMSMDDIRKLEDETKALLDQLRGKDSVEDVPIEASSGKEERETSTEERETLKGERETESETERETERETRKEEKEAATS